MALVCDGCGSNDDRSKDELTVKKGSVVFEGDVTYDMDLCVACQVKLEEVLDKFVKSTAVLADKAGSATVFNPTPSYEYGPEAMQEVARLTKEVEEDRGNNWKISDENEQLTEDNAALQLNEKTLRQELDDKVASLAKLHALLEELTSLREVVREAVLEAVPDAVKNLLDTPIGTN